jgi:putative FmdB family regulatory protein
VPFYEYRCTKGHQFEVRQSMSDEPLKKCQVCGAKASRVLFAPAIHFKGTGFHNTDYASKRRSASGDESGSSNGKAEGGSGEGGSTTTTTDGGTSTPAPAKESSSKKTVGLDKI